MRRLLLTLSIFLVSAALCSAQRAEMFPELKIFADIYAKQAIDTEPQIVADTELIGIWKMEEDGDPHNYFVLERYSSNSFVCTYMNRGGSNRTYEHFMVFFSKIGDTYFANVGYRDLENRSGYFFLKAEVASHGFYMTLSLVDDKTLNDLPDSKAVRDRLTKNVNNPKYFRKPVHFHKILPLLYCK